MGRLLDLDPQGSAVLAGIVTALRGDDLDRLSEQFRSPTNDAATRAALMVVLAEAIRVLVQALEHPWVYDDRAWNDRLPERRPAGRSNWRDTNYALQAAGCLASGVHLDWQLQESYWRTSLWPAQLSLLEFLLLTTQEEAGLPRAEVLDRLCQRLTSYVD